MVVVILVRYFTVYTTVCCSLDTDEWADMDADDETGSCGTSGSAGDVMEDDEDMVCVDTLTARRIQYVNSSLYLI